MTPETTCRFEELDRGALAVTLRPELNEVPWTDIERIGSGIVSRVSGRERPRVIVDLSELNHMGSAMVALVVRIWKAATERDGQMVVVNRHELVGEVLQISGLAGKWTIVPTREEALAELGGSGFGGAGDSRAAVALVVLSGVLLLISILTLADAAFAGVVARSLGHTVSLWVGFGCAVAALVIGVIAVVRAAGNLKLAAVSIATLSAVAAVLGLALLLKGPGPALPNARQPVLKPATADKPAPAEKTP